MSDINVANIVKTGFEAVNAAVESKYPNNANNRAFVHRTQAWMDSDHAVYMLAELDWRNGTGYFDGAAKIPFHKEQGFKVGQVILAFDEVTRRRIAIIVGRYGNVVIFDRFTDGDRGVFVFNAERPYTCFIGSSGALSADNIYSVFSNPSLSERYGRFYEGVMQDFEDVRTNILYAELGKEQASKLV